MRAAGYLALCLLAVLTCLAGVAGAQDLYRVASPAELQTALPQAAAQGGRIDLAGGDYGALSLRDLSAPDRAPLVLRSADPANPARFSSMVLHDVANVTLEGLVFDYTFAPGDKSYFRPFQILNSSGIVIRGSLFDGDRARGMGPSNDGFPTAFGLGVLSSSRVTLNGNEIRGFYRGLVVSQTSEIIVHGTDMHDIRMDGMNFAEVHGALIEGNHIHDFARSLESADHADMIQFWTNRTDSPSRDVVIRNNLLNSGQGWYTQSIFMRNDQVDRGLAGKEMFYRNITIEGNLIINAHLHGITVGETDGLSIRNNTVVRNARSEGARANVALWTPMIRVAMTARNVEIQRNVVAKIVGPEGQPDWVVTQNLLVQDSARMVPGFYGTIFVMDSLRDPTRPSSFAPLPGGPLDGTGIGAGLSLTR